MRAKQRKDRGRSPHRAQPLWFRIASENNIIAKSQRELFKNAVFGFERVELSWRGPILRDVRAWRMRPDDGQPLGIAVRQWAQQEAVDDAEDGRVRADAERERKYGDQGKARVLEQHSCAVS